MTGPHASSSCLESDRRINITADQLKSRGGQVTLVRDQAITIWAAGAIVDEIRGHW